MQNNRGFTLIEVLLVIVLVTSLGAMTTAFMARFLTQNAVQNAQDQIIGDLRKAQFYTMMGKQGLSWGVHYASNTITFFGTTTNFAGRGSASAFDETFTVNTTVSISGLASDIIFSGTAGTPSPTSASITITGSGSNTTKQVTMNSQGMVTR
jgi:prepilin-type N-terminal cleavage/methylation domain-containing protein